MALERIKDLENPRNNQVLKLSERDISVCNTVSTPSPFRGGMECSIWRIAVLASCNRMPTMADKESFRAGNGSLLATIAASRSALLHRIKDAERMCT